MKAGIIGLQGSGKTTIFHILARGKASGGGSGRRQEPNVASIQVPDARLDYLSSAFKPEKTTYAVVEFVDVPALTRGRGQDVALAPLRTVDVLIHVVRAFEDDAVPHPAGSTDSERDRRDLNYELMLADIASIEKRMERLEKDLKKGGKTPALTIEMNYLERAKAWLESEKPLREMETDSEE
jgi:ribosome-binding ATPase YchF (GTP1/OBG family)